MNADSSSSPIEHPSPQRGALSAPRLGFALLAAPAAWMLEELVSYGIASDVCRMGGAGAASALTRAASAWFWGVLAAALLLAVAGTAVAWTAWRRTRGEKDGDARHPAQRSEGRSRFLALSALLLSGGFLFAFLFMLSSLAVAPLCGH